MNAAHALLVDAHLDDGRLIRGELEQLRGEPFTVEVVHAVADALVRLLGTTPKTNCWSSIWGAMSVFSLRIWIIGRASASRSPRPPPSTT